MQDVAWATSNIYTGNDFPRYNPDELLSRKGYKIYQKMMSDEQIKAVVRFKRDAITSRAWQFTSEYEELSEEENALRIKIFEAAIKKMNGSFSDATNTIMSAMYQGFSITEKVMKLNVIDGKSWYGIDHLRLKPCETFYFYPDEFGNILRVTQRMFGDEQDIDMEKFIHYVQNPEWDEQYGRSELRECYRAWFSKDMIIKFQNIHLERFAGGFVWARPQQGKQLNPGTQEYTNLQTVLSNIHTKTSMIVPGGIDLNVVQGATTDIFDKAIAQCDKAIAKSLLVPNLLGISEQGAHGSLAQADSQLEAFLWTLEADATRLEECLNEQLFEDIGDLNFGDGLYPHFKFNPISEKSKLSLIATWSDLVAKGAVEPSDTDEQFLRDLMDMPDKGTPLKTVSQPASGTPSSNGNTPPEPGKVPAVPTPTPGKGNVPPLEETVVGKMGIAVSAFSRAMKRVDFAVIASQSDNASHTTSYDVAAANSDAVKRIVDGIEGITLADIPKIKFTADELGKLKAAVASGLKESWGIGVDHAKRELSKASRQKKFDIGNLSLNELASEFIKSRSFTITGNISGATISAIQNVLTEGVKNSKTQAEMKQEIYKRLESDGMLTDDAVQEALGTTTVKSTNARISTIVRTTSFEAINEARYKVFSDPALDGFVEALEYSAIMDDRVTEICSSLNGDIYPVDDEVWNTFTPPNHYNCRSLLIPVTQRDTWSASEPPSVNPQKGFGFERLEKPSCTHNH
jgi:SPP1 gp7 family putative phage head morphogenesis protein